MTICILGRQPELGIAELESLYGPDAVRPTGENCALVDADVDFSRLGGSVKTARLLTTLNNISRKNVFKEVSRLLPRIVKELPVKGKIKLGLSVYGFDISPYELGGEALRLKKVVRSLGRSVRVVPNEAAALSSAQTYHNHLTDVLGIEVLVIRDGDMTYIGQVTNVQDIDGYRIRDRERPKRDAFVGMLPPKLAQIIINLAVGETPVSSTPAESEQIVLDPFCGTGVILQEALLMGYGVYGTDLSKKMIDYSGINLSWLGKTKSIPTEGIVRLEVADATDHIWRRPVSVVASESYLGQPLGGQSPSKEKFAEIVHDTNATVRDFFKNIASQLEPGTRLCVAVPVWFLDDTVTHLPIVDELASMGFVWHTFTHVVTPLMYHREDQITGRELLVLTKEHHEAKNSHISSS